GLFCFPKEQAMRASVTVRVAGSTSNLGAGFDCVGVAIGRWLRLTARTAPDAAGRLVTIVRGGTLGSLDTAPEADLLYRGFVAACRRARHEVPAGLVVTSLPIHESLALVFAVPDFTVETKHARAALPAALPHADAVRAAAKSAALVHGLAHADERLLAAGLDDVLHVPFRRALVSGYDEVTSAARQAGAYGATLSGSGPTVVAVVVSDGVGPVGDAMVRAWGACGIAAQTFHADRPAGGFETA